MLKNYITIAINNLLKNRLYSAINIIGLAVGLATFILISLYLQNELSYDRHWEKADLIYRINHVRSSDDSPKEKKSSTSALALPALTKYFPEDIEFGTRIIKNKGEIQIGNVRYPVSIALVDEDFINIFQYEVLKGSLERTLQSPWNIALSEKLATIYFGDRNPIGEVITYIPNYGDKKQYKVTAIYRFISPNTTLNIPSFSLLPEIKSTSYNWQFFSANTYIRLRETTDIKKFVDRLPDFVNKTIPVSNMNRL